MKDPWTAFFIGFVKRRNGQIWSCGRKKAMASLTCSKPKRPKKRKKASHFLLRSSAKKQVKAL